MEEFLKQRQQLIDENSKLRFDHDVQLSEKEQKVNTLLKELVKKEVEEQKKTGKFTSGFYERQPTVENSKLYKILKKMPKGALLHAHFLGLFDIKKVIDFAASHENFYMYPKEDKFHPLHQGGYYQKENVPEGYILFSELEKIDKNLKQNVLKNWTMNNDDFITSDRWSKFQRCFDRQWDTLWFEEQFYKNYDLAIESLLEDNIQYVETNVPLGAIFNFEKLYTVNETAEIFFNLTNKYAKEHPKDFYGIHLVHESTRKFNTEFVYERMKESIELQKKYGNFICGYDLVGHEDGPGSHNSLHFVENQLRIMKEAKEKNVDFKFIIHGGESLDAIENLYDLILLESKRIGHGFNLFRYPKLYDLIKEKDICLEVCPISNHVLGYVDDLRNHHAIGYLANNIPMVISPDDPGMMGYQGVTHDYFVAMVYWDLDLSGIKKLILNSIKYSTLYSDQKKDLQAMWEVKYDSFLDDVIKNY
eukprot:gene12692-6586_t